MATDLKLISDLHFAVLLRPQHCPRLLQIRFIERLGSAAHATPTTGGLETCVHPLTQYVTLKLASLDLAPNAIYRYFSDRSALEAALANEAARQLELALRKAANARRGSEQYQSMNSQMACSYERFELADVRLFKTADFDCSRSASLRIVFGSRLRLLFAMRSGLQCRGEKRDPVPDLLTSSAFLVTYLVKLPTSGLLARNNGITSVSRLIRRLTKNQAGKSYSSFYSKLCWVA